MITALANLRPVPLVVLVVVVAAVLVVARRRRGLPAARLALLGTALLAVGGVLVIALLRFRLPVDPGAALQWEPNGPVRFVTDFAVSDEIRLNVLLFVPAALLSTVLTRRPLVVLLGGIALAVLCECVQGAFHSGVPDGSDALAGSLGVLLGVLAGCVLLLIRCGRHPSRRIVVPTAVVAALAVGLLASVPLAASVYETRYAEHLRSRLATVGYDDVERWGHDDASSTADLEHRVWAAGWTRASANRYRPHAADVLYPSSFLLVRQCVLATWTPERLTVQPRSGAICDATWG